MYNFHSFSLITLLNENMFSGFGFITVMIFSLGTILFMTGFWFFDDKGRKKWFYFKGCPHEEWGSYSYRINGKLLSFVYCKTCGQIFPHAKPKL